MPIQYATGKSPSLGKGQMGWAKPIAEPILQADKSTPGSKYIGFNSDITQKGVFGNGSVLNQNTLGGKMAAKLNGPSKKKNDGDGSSYLDKIGQLADKKREETKGINAGLDAADSDYYGDMHRHGERYLGEMKQATGGYKKELGGLMDEARAQSNDAKQVYSGTLQPKLTSMLEKDYAEAYGPNSGGMSLAEAGDPNNRVASAVRDMYNKEGDYTRNQYNQEGQSVLDMFNQQAMNAQNQGLASSGVLGALGAQNAASAFGAGGPMSVGQQQALFAASQGQAGQAFARAQQQMNNLRQQGILTNVDLRSQGLGRASDLRGRGLDAGMAESDRQYGRTERAKGRAKDAASQLSNEQDRFLTQQAGLRGEIGRGAADLMGLDMGEAQATRDYNEGMADIGRSNKYKKGTREMGTNNDWYGTQMGVLQGKQAEKAGKAAGNANMMTGLGGAVGTVAGAYFGKSPQAAMAGGAVGAAAGNAIGSAQGGGAQPPPQQPMYGQPTAYQQGGNPYDPNYGQAANGVYGQRAYGRAAAV